MSAEHSKYLQLFFQAKPSQHEETVRFNDQTRIFKRSPLNSAEEVERLLPGIGEILSIAMDTLKRNHINFNNSYHRFPPSVILAETTGIREFVRYVSQDSYAPNNEFRAYAHFNPYDYAIYFSIDEFKELLASTNPKDLILATQIVLEELIHAYTTNPQADAESLSVGFSKYPKNTKKPLALAAYHWTSTATATSFHIKTAEAVDRPKENPESITLTENLTRLAVLLLAPAEDVLVFYLKSPDNTPLPIFAIEHKALTRIFLNAANRSLAAEVVSILASGKTENITKKLLSQFKVQNPELLKQLQLSFLALQQPDSGVIEINSKNVSQHRRL